MQSAVFKSAIKIAKSWPRAALQGRELQLDHDRILRRIGDVGLANAITSALGSVGLYEGQSRGIGYFHLMLGVLAFDLGEGLAIGDDQLQRTCVRAVEGRVIDFVESAALSQSEPHF